MENLEHRDSSSPIPTLEMSVGIHKAIQAEALLFLPTDEIKDYKVIVLQMTLGNIVNFQRLTMCFARDMGGNYNKTAPILRSYVSEREWNKFYEEQVSANAELNSVAGTAISQTTSAIAKKEDFFSLEEKEIEIKIRVKTAKALVKVVIASMFEMNLSEQQLPEMATEKEKFEHAKNVMNYFENYVWILTQLNNQGIPINSEHLGKYQESVNHLSPLVKQADNLLKGQK